MAAKFKAVLDQPDLLKDSVNVVSLLLNEGVFTLGKDGIILQSMDSANVAMVDMKLLASAFREYTVEAETKIGLNISDLTMVLRRAKADDVITLELQDNTLHIAFDGKVKRAFNVPLLDLRHEAKNPSLTFPSTIEIKTSVLEDGISDAEIISDAVTLETDPDMFTIRAEGDSRKAQLRIEKGNEALLDLKATDHVKSTFPLDYLRKMVKASKLADTCILQLGNDYPLRLDFKVVDKFNLGFILAPRIESE